VSEKLFGIERYQGKVINCLGDSITSDYSTDNSSWCEMIRQSLPVKAVNNYGIAGTMIADNGEREDSFVHRYMDMDKEADVIIVFGGINDFNHSVKLGQLCSDDIHTFYGALNVMCKDLMKIYPEADIMFVTPMHAFGFKDYPHWNTQNEAGCLLKAYRNAILDTCELYSIPVLDLFLTSGMTPDITESKKLFLPDGLHPGKEGRQRLARKIINYLINVL
jgi:lysophospholipase L1-like esterase